MSIREPANFGLEPSNVVQEKYPLVVASVNQLKLKRLHDGSV